MNQNCDSCGARLSSTAAVCDLCGTPTGVAQIEPVSGESPEPINGETTDHPIEPHTCGQCGWTNPEGSKYCNSCGSALKEDEAARATSDKRKKTLPDRGPKKAESPTSGPAGSSQRAVGLQIGIVVGSSLLLVVALYVITSISAGNQTDSDTATSVAEALEEPLAQQWIPRQEELKEALEEASEDEEVELRRQLIDLYFAAGRFDFAAEETVLIAETAGVEEEWIVAGNLYFDWMQRKPESLRAPWAQKAVAAYREALAINPSNLDVRTDMAIAYLYDPQNAMMAIQETNRVLEQDSLHIQANFNRGIMLSQIDRTAQAIEQFEKVKRISSGESDPVYVRAVEAIERLGGGN